MKKIFMAFFLFLINCSSEQKINRQADPKSWCQSNCTGEFKVLIDDSFSLENQKRITEDSLAWNRDTGSDIKLSFETVPRSQLDSRLNHPGLIYVVNKDVSPYYGWTSYLEDQALVLIPDDSPFFDAVAIHEFGHAFHLGDDPAGDDSSVMGASAEITNKDIDTFCNLWRCE